MDSPPLRWGNATATATATGGLILAFIFLYNLLRLLNKRSYHEAPEASGAWPIIGHLRLLSSHPNLGRVFGDIAEKNGPIFTFRLGARRTLVVNSWELAKECLVGNDRALASRPRFAAGKYMGYDFAMVGFAPYGEYWREIRKIVVAELLSGSRLDQLKHVRAAEVDALTKELYELWVRNNHRSIEVEMKEWFNNLAFNVMVSMVSGKRFYGGRWHSDEALQFTKTISEFTLLMGSFAPSDLFPFLKWLDLGGYKYAMKKTLADMDDIMESWLQEHRQRRSTVGGEAGKDHDFIDALLNIVKEEHFTGYEANIAIKAIALTMIIAGADTTSITLSWALSLLLNSPNVLKKAQQEIDTHVGRERHVQESDIKELVYLQAIVKETLRLYPAAPTMIPHEAIENCTVGGYDVPAGTIVMVNAWAIQRDSKVWSDPLEFKPERFLAGNANVDVRGQHFELLPFGSGRRSCPGASLALQILPLTLGRLIHSFEMTTPTSNLVDMSEGAGVTLPKSTPLSVLLRPRLPTTLYE